MIGAIVRQRLLALALSLALTGALMILFKAVHPPAGATTLIVSLGTITEPIHLIIVEIAVVLLTIQSLYAVPRDADVEAVVMLSDILPTAYVTHR
jgi:CBS-domain-containing membrane protein